MKKIFLILIGFTLLFVTLVNYSISQPTNTHKLTTLALKVEVLKEPQPQIKISWEQHPSAIAYEVRKKSLTDQSFPAQALAQLDSTSIFFVDDNVQVGLDYEYEVRAIYWAKQNFRFNDGQGGVIDSTLTILFWAMGYVFAGLEADINSKYDKCLLLVDEDISGSLASEIVRLQNDLISEGWYTVKRYVPRTEVFDAAAVKNVKDIIIEESTKDPVMKMYVFLLGRVAVPYSGNIVPDGHANNHYGAWPCDGYYGSLNENAWTDFSANSTAASRDENKNIPGDGKFDQSTFQYNPVDLPVGRVDFYNMPTFEETEAELLKKYLDKDHAYRTGDLPFIRRGLIDENFGIGINACAGSGWRNFSLFFGVDSVKDRSMGMDWFSVLSKENYMWAYGCGGGSYTSAGGIGVSKQFDTINVNSIFTMLFGSYFGDWDSQNNLMRASLASGPSVLTCAWSGFPQWYFHHMDIGMPIGHSVPLTQNNRTEYLCSVFQFNNQWSLASSQGLNQIHVALMGDPTLTMYMGNIPSPENLSVAQLPLRKVELTWNEPNGEGDFSYNVYRSKNPNGPFEKINTEEITETEFIDENILFGSVHYMVRTEAIETTNSGSFKNLSRGIIQNIVVSGVRDAYDLITSVSCYPNPASKEVNVSLSIDEISNTSIQIFNSRGSLVKTFDYPRLAEGTHNLSWNLISDDGINVSSGVYYVRVTANDKVRVHKFTVIR